MSSSGFVLPTSCSGEVIRSPYGRQYSLPWMPLHNVCIPGTAVGTMKLLACSELEHDMRAASRKMAMEKTKGILGAYRDSLQRSSNTQWWPQTSARLRNSLSQVSIWREATSLSQKLCISSCYGLAVLCSILAKSAVIFFICCPINRSVQSAHAFLPESCPHLWFISPCFSFPKSLWNGDTKTSRPILPAFPRETLSQKSLGKVSPWQRRVWSVASKDIAWLVTWDLALFSRYRGKTYRATVKIVRTSDQVADFCRRVCAKLECCPNLFSPVLVAEVCPENCSIHTKTKYSEYQPKCFLSLAGSQGSGRLSMS